MSATRLCVKCGAEKPWTLEHFYRHRVGKGGMTARCKPCVNEDNRAYHAARLAKEPERVRALATERTKRSYRKDIERSRARQREAARKALSDPARRAVVNARKRGGGAGLTVAEIERILDSQGRKCAICDTRDPDLGRSSAVWNIDHCHSSGAVRGVLCNHCNRGLGAFRDSKSFLLRAVAYLDAAQSPAIPT